MENGWAAPPWSERREPFQQRLIETVSIGPPESRGALCLTVINRNFQQWNGLQGASFLTGH